MEQESPRAWRGARAGMSIAADVCSPITAPSSSQLFVARWLIDRHRVRPELVDAIAEAAGYRSR